MLDIINTRRSVRKWKDEPVSPEAIASILEAAMNAPSAGNAQDWDFIVLTGTVLADYLKINGNVPKGSPAGILVCGNTARQKYDGFFLHDCCAATENILLALHALGLGGVWTALFPEAIPATCRLLHLPEQVRPVSFVPFGVPAKKPEAAKSRYDGGKVYHNTWGNSGKEKYQ